MRKSVRNGVIKPIFWRYGVIAWMFLRNGVIRPIFWRNGVIGSIFWRNGVISYPYIPPPYVFISISTTFDPNK